MARVWDLLHEPLMRRSAVGQLVAVFLLGCAHLCGASLGTRARPQCLGGWDHFGLLRCGLGPDPGDPAFGLRGTFKNTDCSPAP
jgi:hypothetical protein